MSLLPSKPEASPPDDAGPRVIGVDSDDADEVLSALSSGTARRLLAEVHDDPAPPSELADRVDTSLQNAQYHLEKLEDAGAVEVVDTAYSAKGREMDVYAASDQPLVIFAGDQDEGSMLRTALKRLVGALGALAVASLAVQALFGQVDLLGGGADSAAPAAGGGDDGGDGGDGAEAPDGGDGGGAGGETPTGDGDVGIMSGGDGGDAAGTATETVAPEGTPTSTPGAEPTPTPQPEATPTPQATGTPQPEPSPTPQATGTPEPTAAPTPQPTPEPTPTAQPEPTGTPTEAFDAVTETTRAAGGEAVRTAADVGPEAAGGLPPGLLFFAGGAFVLGVVAVALYWRG